MSITWKGHPGPTGRNDKWTSDELPGVLVRHCGHPTALRPYYVDGRLNELGTFRLLKDAQQAAAKVD
jgi:hypothetical protein